MALVNPNIAMSFRGVEIPQQNALADYAAVQQIQSGQRQAEVSQMQLESLRRDQAALAKMQAAITAKGGPSDLNVAADEMIKSGIPEYLKQGLTIKQTLDKQARFASLLGPTGGAAPAAAPASEAYPGYNEAIGMTPSVNAMAPAAAAPVNAMADMQRRINEAYMIGTPEALAFAKANEERLKPMTVSPGASVFQGGQSVFTAPATPAAPPSMVAEYTFAKTPGGGNFKGSYQDFVTARAAAGRAPAAPRPESAPVAVIDPVTGKQIFVTREEALKNRMTPASAGDAKPLTESQGNATAFGMRMLEAQKALTDLEKAGVVSGGRIKGAVEGTLKSLVPFQGEQLAEGAGAIMNVLPGFAGGPSSDQQLYQQAKTNFITAVLRKESGAAIGLNEFQTEDRKYFPQAGDTDKVVERKRKARELAIESMKIQAGPGAKNIGGASGGGEWKVVK